MITIKDFYNVMSAMVPLYAAMFLAYGSVRWWKIFTPVQCAGINRFVAVFAVPLLSFHFISTNNPYKMDLIFILADTLSKLAIFVLLMGWAKFSRSGSLDWMITLFALATLPNTLVMGIPLLSAMYGEFYGGLMVQLVVLQCIIWYTLMLFLFEFRAARLLVMEQFPDTAASIVSFKVESDVMSLDGREPLQTQAEVGEDGKIRVTIRRSTSSRSQALNSFASPRRSLGLISMPSSKAITPRPSNLTGAEIYSVYSSRNNTPRDHGMNNPDLHSLMSAKAVSPRPSNFTTSDIYSVQSSRGPTPRASNFNEDNYREANAASKISNSPRYLPYAAYGHMRGQMPSNGQAYDSYSIFTQGHANSHGTWPTQFAGNAGKLSPKVSQITKKASDTVSPKLDDDSKEMHMFVWSSATSPVSEVAAGMLGSSETNANDHLRNAVESKDVRLNLPASNEQYLNSGITEPPGQAALINYAAEDFSFGSRVKFPGDSAMSAEKQKQHEAKVLTTPLSPKLPENPKPRDMPPALVMVKLILQMVGRKLIRNPNTYSSVIGLTWALISFRWDVSMPKIIGNSISILSDTGLGMAMFSLGLFMALQPRLIACGASLATFAMAVRFLTGPAAMAAASIAVGLRGVDLHAAIVQAALPQGIVPFVFAREYDLHPEILSTAVIFGMLVALPTTLLYYVFLGL
ncbi:hypothetical protein KP509_15G071700 [Ceratopteris richardii]|uniref:Auxin efflux carrier component n=1 Tax=Ceratopteris richardii TaxID=49495 RepID=A0A8T2T4N6_CERRI|nr:hypothetical protein KP509_15G071700 [Ceratopteris richardii]